jgi:hypothetical protein
MPKFPNRQGLMHSAVALVLAALAVLACSMPPALADSSASTAVFYVY